MKTNDTISLLFIAVLSLLSLSGLHAQDKGETFFYDASSFAGINAPHGGGYDALGQAWGDYNQDGWADLYLTNSTGANTLYQNNGDGTFNVSPLSASVALSEMISGGAVFADYNNDGWPDLYVLNSGANSLFRNEAGNGFTDVTEIAGVGDVGVSTTAAWGDFDKDGYLDLYVANFNCPMSNCPLADRDGFYYNNGDGTFTDITEILSGLDTGPPRSTFVASFLDYDNDGDLDIYSVYDHEVGNDLWRNDGPGCEFWCFTNVSAAAGADTPVDGMGLAIGDYDNDGDLDMYFTDALPLGVLLQNQTSQGSPTFTDVTTSAGVMLNSVGWGAVFFDYNNDSWLDLYVASTTPDPAFSNRLYHNLADGTFADTSTASGAANTGATLGVAYADYDKDGQVDLVIGNQGEGYHLYQNQGAGDEENKWLTVRLQGGGPVNRDAIGSRAYLYMSNGLTQLQEVKCGSSLGAGNDLDLHFGLGQGGIDSLAIVWPDGLRETFQNIAANQFWSASYPVQSFDAVMNAGWNLVGLPLEMGDTHYLTLFPNAAPNTLFSYDGEYVTTDSLEAGQGYWLNFPAGETVQLQGTIKNSVTIDLVEGWNLICGPWCAVPVSAIDDPGGIIVPNTAHGFDGGYFPTTIIEPGKGYWIKASAAGQVTLSCDGL